MTQHLQKLFLGFFVSAFSILAFTVDTQAQTQLNTVWDNTTVTSNLPSWFAAGYVRGIAHGTVDGNERVYAADRTNTAIEVMDAATGAAVTPTTAFDLSGVSGGTYPMNDIEVSDDGVIFLGNLASDTKPFRLYWWSSEGGAFTDSTTIPVSGRAGDKFTVVGSLADNTIEVWIPVANSDPGVVYVATTADQGANWDIETITLSGTAAALAGNVDAAPLALGRTSDFYIAGNGNAPARYSSAGAYVTDSEFSSTSRNGFDLFSLDGSDYMAVYSYRADGAAGGDKTGRVLVYDVTDGANPTLKDESPLMGPDADTYSSIHGDVEISLKSDSTFFAYALEGVNGIAAYANFIPPVIDAPSNLIFSEYIEGSSNNKALEITNLSDSTVQLANYQIAQTNNGSDWKYFFEFAAGASIDAGETYVLITDAVDASLFDASGADEVLSYPSPIHYNGDDARGLIHIDAASGDTTMIDLFGEVGRDPGSAWDVAGVTNATAEHTLIRKPGVTSGNIDSLGSFGTTYGNSEWLVMPQNYFDNLGKLSSDLFATPLAGEYFVPQRTEDAQGFSSLVEALYYVEQSGLSGATTLFITSDITDTSGIAIHREDLTESTSLTIKPATGITATLSVISGGGDGIGIIKTDHVTIDGSNTVGGDTRDLTITSADDGLSNLIWTKETSGTTIANTNLTYTGAASPTGIATNESGAKATDGLTVSNNSIGSVNGDFSTAVGVFGYTDNNVTNTTVAHNRLYATYRGIATWRAEDNTFVGNTISIDSPSEDKSRYGGIYLALNFGTTDVIGNEIVGLQVNRSTDAGYAAGILFNAALGTVNIINNTIAVDNFANTGAATGNKVFGIGFDNAAGNSTNHVYHNTVRIGSSSETGVHAAFGAVKNNSTAQIWDLQNNIFTVEQDDADAFVMYWPIPDVANLQADYNNYYVSGSSASIAYSDAAATQTLGDWQTAVGIDARTTDAEVEFVSATDLRLTGASIGDNVLAGTPIAFVTDDIDGTPRSAVAPYKGAFEGSTALTPMPPANIEAFALLAPADEATIELKGDSSQVLAFSWSEAASNEDVTYVFHLDSLNGDFSAPLFSAPSDSNGIKAVVEPTYAEVDSLLATLGVDKGASITLQWTVTAMARDSVRSADASHKITLSRLMDTSKELEIETPQEFSLSQNYPNPFNPTSNIRFTLPQSAKVTLQVFNITGQLVATLANGKMSAGEHTVQFNASNLASGVYIYRMIAGDFVQTKKMTLIK